MTTIKDFFTPTNTVNSIPYNTNQTISVLIKSIQAIARITYQSIYLIDYYNQCFLYVSDNHLFLCGHSAEEVKELGNQFYLDHVPENEQKMLVELNSNGFKFFDTFNKEDKLKCSMSYDFHLKYGRKKILVNHKITPILLTDEGRVWIALCFVSMSAKKTPGHIQFHLEGTSDYWKYSFETHKWKLRNGVMIKDEEKEVLRLSAEGLTMAEIANNMCKSTDAIKFYRRNLFEKLKVTNITEAISHAIIYKLL